MELKRIDWGVINNQKVELLTIKDDKSGYEVQLTNIGASIVRVKTPDKENNIGDICFGRNTAQDYYENSDGACFGATIGRYAAIFPYAKFSIDGIQYNITPNMLGVHHQHGGKIGFNKKVWKIETITNSESNIIIMMSFESPDGEEGFPGTLKTEITFEIKPMFLSFTIKSTTDKSTIINLTNHSYWNLNGLSTNLDNLQLSINSSEFTAINIRKIIFSTLARLFHLKSKIGKNPFYLKNLSEYNLDFKSLNLFSSIFEDFGNLDYSFLLDGYKDKKEKNELLNAAEMYSPTNGRYMSVKTTEPSVLLYSGNSMGSAISFGEKCQKHGAICFETVKPLNAIQFPEFKDMVILRPNEEYNHKTEFEFSVKLP